MKSPFHSCSKDDTVCDEELSVINGTECTAGLTIVPVPLWEGSPSRGPQTNVEFFYHAVWTSECWNNVH